MTHTFISFNNVISQEMTWSMQSSSLDWICNKQKFLCWFSGRKSNEKCLRKSGTKTKRNTTWDFSCILYPQWYDDPIHDEKGENHHGRSIVLTSILNNFRMNHKIYNYREILNLYKLFHSYDFLFVLLRKRHEFS